MHSELDEFLTNPMTVPGQLALLVDECPPHGIARPVGDDDDAAIIQ